MNAKVLGLTWVLLGGLLRIALGASGLPAGFSETTVATGLGDATCMAWAPDSSNRLFLTMKGGAIRIVKNGTLLAAPFATLSPITSSECGVLSVCFDPNFAANHWVYAFYTFSPSEQRIVRFTDVNDLGGSLTNIVTGLPTNNANHDGGGCSIGPDGKLYWAIGDNGNGAGVNANLTSLASKCGRANLDGSAPNDNPFYNSADGIGPTDYIWASGLRNPFTHTWQLSTGKLWINVVGANYEQIFTVNRKDTAGYNAYENNQPAGTADANGSAYINPRIVYRTNGTYSATFAAAPTGAVRSGNVVTFTTTAAHGFRGGGKITASGVADASFNGSFYVATVPSLTTFTAAQSGANASSGGGSAATPNFGGCVTGGAFYDATWFPSAYQGNFFFGDFNTGNLLRATFDGSNNVASVDLFASGVSSIVDVNAGPDGALYYVQRGGSGSVFRLGYTSAAQDLVVAPGNLLMAEGGSGVFAVRLAMAPAANVTVNVARTAGDTDISVSPATLTFTPANWSTPQFATVSAAEDADTTADTASISVSSSGLTTRTVGVRAVDNDEGMVVSAAMLSINEGSDGTFTVRLSNAPTSNVTVGVARTSGDADITPSPAALTFTPANFATPQSVTVSAANDADAANDAAILSLTSTGLATRTVSITAIDKDASAPSITSSPVTTAVNGIPYSYDVNATGTPTPTYSLTAMPTGMSINSTSGAISWTPSANGPFGVTVKAANGVSPDATQSFTVTVNADQPPTAVLTRPTEGEIVAGTNAEFFGDGVDDAGTTKAEFYVDGVLKYTDVNSNNHFHYGGAHQMWDTTKVSEGSHVVKITVYDAKNQSGSAHRNIIVRNIKHAKSDFDGDQKGDILFRLPSSGNVYLWLMR